MMHDDNTAGLASAGEWLMSEFSGGICNAPQQFGMYWLKADCSVNINNPIDDPCDDPKNDTLSRGHAQAHQG